MVNEEKKQLRKSVRSRVKNLSVHQKRKLSGQVFSSDSFKQEISRVNTMMFYWSMPDEIYTHEIIPYLSYRKQVLLPVIDNDDLLLRQFRSVDDLQPEKRFGILEPSGPAIDHIIPDIIIIPGVAFDPQCNRLGRGKAFYDRLLKRFNTRRVALAFDEQIVEAIPMEEHDKPADIVITPTRVFCP